MTQQFFPQQGFPAQPQQFAQPAPAPVQQGFPAQQGYGQQAPQQGFPAQQGGMGWGPQQGYGQAPAPAGPPPVAGSLDAFNAQPATGRPPGVSFKGTEPGGHGSVYGGTVVADVTDRDVAQDVDYDTKQPKFYRDGRPQFHMAVTLQLQEGTYNPAAFPGGLATLYVRGRMADALNAGMAAAGIPTGTAPKAGDQLVVALVERRPGRGSVPANIFQVNYVAGPGHQNVGAPAPAAQQAPAPAPAAQTQQDNPPVQDQPEQPTLPTQPEPVQQQAPAPAAAAPVQQVATPNGMVDISPEQQALLAKNNGGQG